MRRSDISISRVIAVALLIAAAPLSAQDMGGVAASRRATSAVCRAACDTLATATRAEDADLRAALASVPVSRRPLGLITQQLNITMGGGILPTTVTTVWALFPNGYATDCFGWDPRQIAATPTSLRGHQDDCSVAAWRRTADGVMLTDADGEASGPYGAGEIRRFAPGQRVAQRMRSYGPSVAAAGFIRVDITDMTLTAAGTVRFMNRNREWQGGGSTDVTRAGQAHYYFDGHLAAVRFPNGRIEIFITGHTGSDANPRDLSYIYWNGALFGVEDAAPR